MTVLSGTTYLVVQQNYRQNANDPQIQMAEDIANTLYTKQVSDFDSKNKIELEAVNGNLSPFVIIYDKDGRPVASQVTIAGKIPELPKGVFDYVRKYPGQGTEDRITWQPTNPVSPSSPLRIAAVIVGEWNQDKKEFSHFVLAGRNLREVENREDRLTLEVLFGWLVAMLGSLILKIIFSSH